MLSAGLSSAGPGSDVLLDATGQFPALVLARGARRVAINGRRNPVADAERHLARALRGADPSALVVIGLGLGYLLEALERRGSRARVLALEPLAESLPHFHARRDWSGWLDGRLQIVDGPGYAAARQGWAALDPDALPPVIVDPGLEQARPDLVLAARAALMRAQFGSRFDLRRAEVKQSMLHEDVLVMLEHAAATAKGAVVEIGAYVGGGTVAMTRGIRDSGRETPMFTIEPGGAHLAHPQLPTSDIFGDLQHNLRARGLDGYTTLLRGHSASADIVQALRAHLDARGTRIGLLCIDADGQVERDLGLYLPYCADGCVLVVDDYSGPPDNIKAELTQAPVDALVASGRARALGVFGWGTWIGVYTPAQAGAPA